MENSIVRKTVLACALLVCCFSVFAGQATVTWQPPTKNCDGTAVGELSSYILVYGQKKETLPLTSLSKTITGLTPGVWWFGLKAVNIAGIESEVFTVEKTVAPEEFVVRSPEVFAIVQRVNRIVLTKVGTVPLGTVCDANQTIGGMYVVPRSTVAWAGTVQPYVVVASCQ